MKILLYSTLISITVFFSSCSNRSSNEVYLPDLCSVNINGLGTVYVDSVGTVVFLSKRWIQTGSFKDGFAPVVGFGNGKYGVVDSVGRFVVKCKYQKIYSSDNGLFIVQDDNGKWGMIDEEGNVVVECKYQWIYSSDNGLIRVQDDNRKWGMIDEEGNVVVECKYQKIYSSDNGLFTVQDDNGKWGMIDEEGNVVIKCQYIKISYYMTFNCLGDIVDIYNNNTIIYAGKANGKFDIYNDSGKFMFKL